MNIFEGSRRVVKLISVAIVVGFGIAAFFVDPGVNIEYMVRSPNSMPQRIDSGNCPTGSGVEYTYPRTRNNIEAYMKFCFAPQTFKLTTGKEVHLIPFEYDEKTKKTSADWPVSSEVKIYQDKLSKSFVMPIEDELWVDDKFRSLVIKELRNGFIAMIISLAILWAFTIAVGWIVRGFMGIPRGQDATIKVNK